MTGRRWRRHQGEALAALGEAAAAGRRRAWVVLPPGAGKTRVGLETARRMLEAGDIDRAVALSPNTAIQGQWITQATEVGVDAGDDRALVTPLTSLTYQSVAVFDPDAEVTDDAEEQALLARLHVNGRLLLEQLQQAGRVLLVLDECHHLLEVWGRLLGELLDRLPRATVLGLTATPPETLSQEQAALVAELFGEITYEASLPAVVREGDLAPFAELAWLTAPTPAEDEWLAAEAERFATLVTRLTDPASASLPFLAWLDRRFVEAIGEVTWLGLSRRWPPACAAALRMHHAGLLALPEGARPTEEHRHDPTAEDWVVLLDDWLTGYLARSEDPRDVALLEEVRRTLPSVGYQWTRSGIRRGRSAVDRVLSRSESKARATVEIVDHEHRALGDRLRMLVLCDHERASATLPVGLDGVLDAQAGSAHAVLQALVAAPATAGLRPLLVTGSTVAGAEETVRALAGYAAEVEPRLAGVLDVEPFGEGTAHLAGRWTSRTWVPLVTRFFERGDSRVLVGTRALLGEGWDARRVTGLVDLTAVTTTTAVVQTRGRALRTDPDWPEKVAVNWTVTCVTDRHPKGDNDWQRLVRKHRGYYAIDTDGDVVDGVAHLDPLFSPYAPPAPDLLDEHNARAVVRAEDRAKIAAQWRVGEPYDDRVARTVRILPRRSDALGSDTAPAAVVVGAGGLVDRVGRVPGWWAGPAPWWTGSGAVLGALVGALVTAVDASLRVTVGLLIGLAVGVAVGLGAGVGARRRQLSAYGRGLLSAAARPPSVVQMASAVADGLREVGLVSAGAERVEVEVDSDGEYRCVLSGVDEHESQVFATALDEALAPVDGSVRYLVPRWTVLPDAGKDGASRRRTLAAAQGRLEPDGVVWHPVPSVLGVRRTHAAAYGKAFDRWVGGGEPVYTGSPDGIGVLAAQQGSDPFSVATVMRRRWT